MILKRKKKVTLAKQNLCNVIKEEEKVKKNHFILKNCI